MKEKTNRSKSDLAPVTMPVMPLEAVALQLVRLLPSGQLRSYEARTFVLKTPNDACKRWLHRTN